MFDMFRLLMSMWCNGFGWSSPMLPLPGVPSKQCYHCLPETKFKFDTSELAQLALPHGSVVVWLSPPK